MYRFPVYKSPLWTGIVKKLRFDPIAEGGAGQAVEVDRIVADYDSRAATTNAVYVLAAWRYYAWTGRATVFTLPNSPQGTVLDRARIATRFLQTELGGDANSYILVNFRGHDGLPGKVNGQLNKGHGIQSNIHDGLPIGHKDAFATIHYYAALRAISELELEAERHPEWGVAPNPYGETSQTYAAKAEAVRLALVQNFWIAAKGRLMMCRDINNTVRDYGHTATNLLAAFYGALDEARAEEVMDWIGGDRLVAGDLSQGSDIYHWAFVPRMTTQDTVDWYIWPMYMWFGLNTAPGFGDQVQNGGAWSYSSFFDVVNRARLRGADDAWARVQEIVDWFDDTRAAGGYENYYATHDGDLQCYTGEGQGSVGLACEFPESFLMPLSFAYAFLGIDASIDGLRLHPALPSALTSVGLERLYFRGYFYDVHSNGDPALVMLSHEGAESPLPNEPRVLPLTLEGLAMNACYERLIENTTTKETTTTYSYSDAQGRLGMTLSLPAHFSLTVSLALDNTWCGPPDH